MSQERKGNCNGAEEIETETMEMRQKLLSPQHPLDFRTLVW